MVSDETLRRLVAEPAVIARWESLISPRALASGCRIWVGAISGAGHGRFWLGVDDDDRDVVMIAHRFGYAYTHGVSALQAAQVVRHLCDEPSCQLPEHWAPGTVAENSGEWAARRLVPGSPLRDVRGARGRAEALRAAAITGADLDEVALEGIPAGDRLQDTLPLH